MKRVLAFILLLALAAGLLSASALASDSVSESTLSDPGKSSANGELSLDWSPESLDDEPYLVTYEEEAPIMMFAARPAAADEEDSGSDEPAEEEPADDGYSPNTEDGSYYDPRLGGITVPIRDQGVYSSCWAVAAITCAELDGLKQGLLSGSPNLSEYHLEYFARKGFTDTLGNTQQDRHTVAPLSGGNPILSVMTLASWAGPADETRTGTPYSSISSSASLSNDIAMTDELHLEKAYWLSMAGQEDWLILQDIIRRQGGAVLCINYDDSYFSSEYNSYHCPDSSLSTNHEVTVVGWDDNFPKEYFAEMPAGNGAWLCRNSRGEGWGDGGYFWLSYYDAVLRQSTAAAFFYGSADNYDNNYQYDACAVNSHIYQANVDTYANVFTAAANAGGHEQLQAVSTYTYYPGTSYTLTVYTDLTDPSQPDSGTAAVTQSGSFPYAGFYTVELSQAVDLYEGQTFSVVFTVSANSDGRHSIPTCSTNSGWGSVNTISAGESFVKFDSGKWYDMTVLTNSAGVPLNSNVRIKAYTVNKSSSVTVTLDAGSGTLPSGASPLQLAWGQMPGDKLADPTREGYDFLGWLRSDGETVTADSRIFASCTLQAQWLRSWNDPFTDLSSSRWYYGNVKYCYQHELINGVETDLFGVSENATRAQIVTVLYRMAGSPAVSGDIPFDDVSASSYAADAIRWAADKQIVLGSDDDGDGSYSFRPGDYVTRQDFLLMLYRYAKWSGMDTSEYESTSLDAFGDADRIGSWALTAEKWSVGCGLQKGDGSNLYPRDNILRPELAALLSRFDGYEEA